MPSPLVEAPPEAVLRLQELQAREKAYEARKAQQVDVFAKLEFVPNPGPQSVFLGLPDENIDVLFGGAVGGAKGGRCPDRTAPSYNASMETRVLTPKGFKLIGDIEPGDQVCNPDGTIARVIRVTDNGRKQFYRVTLADGSSVEADEDHLWPVATAGARKRRRVAPPVVPAGLRPEDEWNLRAQSRYRVVSTVQLRDMVATAHHDRETGQQPRSPLLPLTAPVNLTGAKGRWERFSPYVLGALVGDGHLAEQAVTITGIDGGIFERMAAELPAHLRLQQRAADRDCPLYGIVRAGQADDSEATAKFTAEIRRLLVARGWRQADLVAASGTNQSYLSGVMRGTKRPSHQFTAALDELLGAGGTLLAIHGEHAGVSAADLLARDGLAGTRSWDKFIPERIKLAPVPDRFAFIQGLMDTDGTMDDRGHVTFTTVSERLARDTQEVLRSLGYRATMSAPSQPTYTHGGEKLQGRPAYRLYIQGRHPDRLFHLPRKRERVAKFNGGDVEPWHRVVSVEPSGVDYSRCITVDNPNGLYVTDDYIVTHNSTSLLMYALRVSMRFPGLQTFWFRRTFPELEHSVLRMLARYGYAKAIGCRWRADKYELRFPGGSVLTFAHAKDLKEASAFLSAEINLLLLDERTTFPPDVVDILYTRIRSGVAGVPCLGVRSATNPGDVGHSRVLTGHIEPTEHGRKEILDENNRRRIFIQSKITDTPQLGPEYLKNLGGLPEKLRKAYVEGDWSVFAGQVFDEWRHDRHVVKPFVIPESWRRYDGVDWGFAAPWAVMWGAVDEDGRVWVYRELYGKGVGETDQAKRILASEQPGEHVAVRWADDAMWATRGEEKPIAQVYAENGVYLEPAGKGPGSRITRVQRTRSYLADGPACPMHRGEGQDTCPKLHVFETCANLIRTLPALPHEKTGNVEDVDSDAEDHAYDALSYMLVNLGGGPAFVDSPERPQPSRPDVLDPLGVWAVREETPVIFTRPAGEAPAGAVQRSPFA
jgi:transcriptional regulator with XRE-family HTH domain